MRLRAISEELQQSLAADEFVFSGPCVDCLQSGDGDIPVRPKPETLSVHAGEREGRPRVADSLATPIVQTATYTFRSRTLNSSLYHIADGKGMHAHDQTDAIICATVGKLACLFRLPL